ncbi:MAG: response regulator [Planctomycetes bacterium]|nr:response regulator [Planctomycetota bacterium]
MAFAMSVMTQVSLGNEDRGMSSSAGESPQGHPARGGLGPGAADVGAGRGGAEPAGAADPDPDAALRRLAASPRPRVVLVEDDDVDVMVFERGLKKRRLEHRFGRARDGREAIEMLRGLTAQVPPEPFLVLLDINMPRMNGHEFLDELRQDGVLAQSVVIVLTTSDDVVDIRRAYERNVAGYIVKNGEAESQDRLFSLVDNFLRTVTLPTS